MTDMEVYEVRQRAKAMTIDEAIVVLGEIPSELILAELNHRLGILEDIKYIRCEEDKILWRKQEVQTKIVGA